MSDRKDINDPERTKMDQEERKYMDYMKSRGFIKCDCGSFVGEYSVFHKNGECKLKN